MWLPIYEIILLLAIIWNHWIVCYFWLIINAVILFARDKTEGLTGLHPAWMSKLLITDVNSMFSHEMEL